MDDFKRNHQINRNEAGFSLVEVMAAMALSAIVALGMAMMMQYQSQAARGQNMTVNATSLVTYLQSFVTASNVNYASNNNSSVTGNAMLNCCVNGGCAAPGCVATSGGTQQSYSFILNDSSVPSDPIVAGLNTALTGNSSSYSQASNTFFYDINGSTAQCGPKVDYPNCILQAVASFAPTCPGATASCNKAQSIAVSVSIQSAMLSTGPVSTPGGIPLTGKLATTIFPVPLTSYLPGVTCSSLKGGAGNKYICVRANADGTANCQAASGNLSGGWADCSAGIQTTTAGTYTVGCVPGQGAGAPDAICVRVNMSNPGTWCDQYSAGSWTTCASPSFP